MDVCESLTLTCPMKGSEGTREGKIRGDYLYLGPQLYIVETSIAIKTNDMAHLLNKNLNSCFNEIQCWQINIKIDLVSSLMRLYYQDSLIPRLTQIFLKSFHQQQKTAFIHQ